MKNIIAVVGQTASGKSEYAIKLAKEIDAEIINFDIYQMYKEFDIGTNKTTDYQGIKNYFVSWLSPTEEYNIFRFQKDCRKKIEEILNKGKKVILVGGSHLYLNAVIFDYQFRENTQTGQFNNLSLNELQELVKKMNIQLPKTFDYKNPRRLIRVLETKGEIKYNTKKIMYDIEIHYIKVPKEKLIITINDRVEKMFELGWVDEVKSLLSKYETDILPFKAIGYLLIKEYLEGKYKLEEVKELIKTRTRQYAKRQEIWLKYQLKPDNIIELH